MDWEKFSQNANRVINKVGNYMEKEIERKERELRRELSHKTDDELIRVSRNANLNEFQRELLEEEMEKRGIRG